MIDGRTQLAGIIGWPVSHSFSPAMHNAAAAALNLNVVYVPLPVHPDRLADGLRGLVALGYRGANITVPHKQAVMPLLDHVEPTARAIRAVNTIVIQDGQLAGHNTDWSGFLADLAAHGVTLEGRQCLVLGAGGAARAVAYGLLLGGAELTVAARRPEQAVGLAADLAGTFTSNPSIRAIPLREVEAIAMNGDSPLIVNTTPLGMAGEHAGASPWPEGLPFPSGAFVYDLVYNPARTRLLGQAEAAGCRTANGLGMLVGQAAEAFTLFTGRAPDRNVMRQAIAPAHNDWNRQTNPGT